MIKDGNGNYRFAYPDGKRNEIQKRIEAAQQVGALVAASVEKGKEKPLPEIIPVKRESAEEAPPIIKPPNTPPPKDDDTRNMCIMCGVGISKAVAAISNRKVQQTVCLQCREKILKGRYKK